MRSRVSLAAAAAATALIAALAPAPAAAEVVATGRVTFVADGDTVDVDLDGDGTAVPVRVRVTGIQAMELSVYSRHLDRIRGECHGVEATKRMYALVFGKPVRLTSRSASSRSGTRLRRSVAVELDGTWRDVGQILVSEGHALWMSRADEYDYNRDYAARAVQAASAGIGIWDRDFCGSGPDQGAPLTVRANWDAPGYDSQNVNGEYIQVTNAGPTAVPISGWWVRDSHLRRFTFPTGTVVPARGSIYVHAGSGTSSATRFYWGQAGPVFENVTGSPTYEGDGAYLFDPQGDLRAWHQYGGGA